ncbi:MAG: C4-type zinc ribbon domain-containing protein, partial [Actinomycetota bacterium]|nr:C4-type zinc ribbon domain-containing protein [Actinomycetota bacterium]
ATLQERLAVREGEIDREIDAVNDSRAAAAAVVPDDLLETYARLREHLGGVGAARLVGPLCSGCHLRLPASALDQMRRQPSDTLFFCEQCGRILVRT